jgi:hypothetical protein
VLQQVAQSGEVDDDAWPVLRDALLSRLKQVIALIHISLVLSLLN